MVFDLNNGLFSGIKSIFSGGIGNDEDNNENDVIKARDGLAKAGYEAGEKGLGILDRALDTATKAFQKDNGLKIDGVMKPGGETETTLRAILNRKSGKSPEVKGKGNNFFPTPPKPLKLQSSIGDGYDNTVEDIGALENVLAGLGHLKLGDLNKGKGKIRQSIIASTKDFQKKNGLFVDGVIKPNGETQQALNEAIKPYTGFIAERQPTEKKKERFVLIPEVEQEEASSQVFGSGMDKEHFERTGEIRMSLTGENKSTPLFDKFKERLGPREGGFVDNPRDKGGATNKGISQTLLDAVKDGPEKEKYKDFPDNTIDLTDEQIIYIAKEEIFDKLKIDKLDAVAGNDKTGSKLVEHVFDAGFMSGITDSGKWLQQSIDETIGTDLKETNKDTGNTFYDGNIGPKTRDALANAIEQGKLKDVSKLFADKRIEYLRKHSDYDEFGKGWEARVADLRDEN